MRRKLYLVFELLMVVALLGLIVAFSRDISIWTFWLKTVASMFFVLAGLCGYSENKGNMDFFWLMLFGFIGCMSGDILLALDSRGVLFMLGIVSFALAHVLYSIAFCGKYSVRKVDVVATGILFAGLLVLLLLGNFDFQGLFPAVVGYAVIISFMVIKAISLRHCHNGEVAGIKLIMLGGVIFLISDIVLCFYLFGADIGIETKKVLQSINWILYYLSQGCMTAALNSDTNKIKFR